MAQPCWRGWGPWSSALVPLCLSTPALGCGSRARQSLLHSVDLCKSFGMETSSVRGENWHCGWGQPVALCLQEGRECTMLEMHPEPASARAGYSLQWDFVHYLTPVFSDRSLPSAETGAVYWGQLHSSVMGAGMCSCSCPHGCSHIQKLLQGWLQTHPFPSLYPFSPP